MKVITITLNMFMASMCVSAIAGGLALWTSERMIVDYHRLQDMEQQMEIMTKRSRSVRLDSAICCRPSLTDYAAGLNSLV